MPPKIQLTKEQRIFIVLEYETTKNCEQVKRVFNETFPERNSPDKKTVYCTVRKFSEHGSISNRYKGNSGRKIIRRTENNIAIVQRAITENSITSVRRNETNLSKSTFHRILKKDIRLHPYNMQIKHDKPRTACPRKINDRAARKLVRTVVQRPHTTREELKNDLKASGIEASKHTISRALCREGLLSLTHRRTPLFQKRHVKARLKYANDHLNKPTTFWTSELWSNETKIELFGRNNTNHVWRQQNEEYKPINHGVGIFQLITGSTSNISISNNSTSIICVSNSNTSIISVSNSSLSSISVTNNSPSGISISNSSTNNYNNINTTSCMRSSSIR
ncbi:Transposase Tc1-like [Trinorchestia longiramus]|nr:Transposase Tc1-like [Trinorchestia longiramus]